MYIFFSLVSVVIYFLIFVQLFSCLSLCGYFLACLCTVIFPDCLYSYFFFFLHCTFFSLVSVQLFTFLFLYSYFSCMSLYNYFSCLSPYGYFLFLVSVHLFFFISVLYIQRILIFSPNFGIFFLSKDISFPSLCCWQGLILYTNFTNCSKWPCILVSLPYKTFHLFHRLYKSLTVHSIL